MSRRIGKDLYVTPKEMPLQDKDADPALYGFMKRAPEKTPKLAAKVGRVKDNMSADAKNAGASKELEADVAQVADKAVASKGFDILSKQQKRIIGHMKNQVVKAKPLGFANHNAGLYSGGFNKFDYLKAKKNPKPF